MRIPGIPSPSSSSGIGAVMLRASSFLPLALSSLNVSSSTSMRLSSILSSLHLPTPRRTMCFASVPPPLMKIPLPSAASPHPFSHRCIQSMLGNRRLKGRVSFSSGNTGGDSTEILVQHLLVGEDDLKLLMELQQRIAAGEDLSDLAVEFSACPSRENGGMLGWVRRGQMVPEFEEAAFSAPLNKVVRCKTTFGWHLLQVLSERVGTVLQDIQPEELHSKMQDPAFFEESQLIDVREPDEVAQASLPGFKVLPLQQFGTWGAEITNMFDPQKETYILCHHGARSLQVAKWLHTQGFKKVFNITGGIHAYAIKADTSVPTY